MTPGQQQAFCALVKGLLPKPAQQVLRAQLVEAVSKAPFSTKTKSLQRWCDESGIPITLYLAFPHPDTRSPLTATTALPSDVWHAVKHTVDGGWPLGTTTAAYVQSLKKDISAACELLVGRYGSLNRAFLRTTNVPGLLPQQHTVAFLDTDRGELVSGYRVWDKQVASLTKPWDPKVPVK